MHRSEIVLDCKYPGINPVSFGFENCTPCHAFGPAVRQYWLLHYVVSGKGRFLREGKSFELSAGDIFIIPPYIETYYAADKNEPWSYIWVGFTSDMELPAALSQCALHCPEASAVFDKMKRCALLENGKSAHLAGCIWELMSIFLECGKQNADYIDKALSFIHAQYSTDISVKTLADKLNVDRSHFSTAFKKRTGVSPAAYIRSVRLERAAELIRVHGESPSVAAFSVGFDDLSHFSKSFKKYFGVSPREFK